MNDIDTYISAFPADVQSILQEFRQFVQDLVPEATEAMAYGIPTFKLAGKNLVHFAAFKSHIGFYPAPSGIEAFEKELAPYKAGKGTIQFPLDKPIPYDLVKKVVLYRMQENMAKAKSKH